MRSTFDVWISLVRSKPTTPGFFVASDTALMPFVHSTMPFISDAPLVADEHYYSPELLSAEPNRLSGRPRSQPTAAVLSHSNVWVTVVVSRKLRILFGISIYPNCNYKSPLLDSAVAYIVSVRIHIVRSTCIGIVDLCALHQLRQKNVKGIWIPL